MLLQVSRRDSTTAALKQSFYLVPRALQPDLDTRLEKAVFVDPDVLVDFPPGLGRQDVWVVDQ
eukprot:3410154-Lingulodinium_polyedra.AAC.1